MTRFTEKEKAELSRAMAPGAAFRTDRNEPAARQGSLLQRWRRRNAVVQELSQLDDRMLDDIGIARWQIDEIADEAVGGERPSLLAALVEAITAPIVRWHRRNQVYRELYQLDDRMLADIGVSRSDIPSLVEGWDGTAPDARAEQEPSVLRGIRQWNRSRATAKALHALDNHMLEDIGLVRGDIDWVAEELAAQSAWTAANRNHQQRAA